MERPSKRVRMSLPSPHPVALLLDDAFRAFFTKREAKKRPIAPPQPFNTLAYLKKSKRYAKTPAKHPDASVYLELPYDVQGLVRKFTPHPVSLLVKDAHNLWCALRTSRKHWPSDEQIRFREAHRVRDSNVRVAHFSWLQDRSNYDAWVRTGVTAADMFDDDEPHDSRDNMQGWWDVL